MTWTKLQQHFQSLFFPPPPNTNSSFLLTTYETAAVDRFIQTHSLGSGFLNGFHDGIHVEVAFTGGSWANTDSFIRHFHMNLKRQISALTDAPSKKNYHHMQIYTKLQISLYHMSCMCHVSDLFQYKLKKITIEQISSETILIMISFITSLIHCLTK